MIDFKIAFQNDELLYGDYENVSLISKIMSGNSLRQFETKTAILISLTKFKQSMLLRKRISHYQFGILIVSVSSSISSILLESA